MPTDDGETRVAVPGHLSAEWASNRLDARDHSPESIITIVVK